MQAAPQRYRTNTSSFQHYWTKGPGMALLHKLGYTPPLKHADQYIPLLFETDDSCDDLVQQLHQHIGFKKGNEEVMRFLKERQHYSGTDAAVLQSFFDSFEQRPDWVNEELLCVGAELSRRPGISALIVLRDYCLMGGYESSAINKPLIYTGALKKGAVKRLTDTVTFWVNITRPGAFDADGEGFQNVILTRIIHSFSRVNILHSTDWDADKWGMPVNTWDLLATNLGFSLVFIVGLRRMGYAPTAQEVKGLFHFWKYIGYLIGIPLHLLPDTEEQAIEALYYWTMTQADGDEDSKSLALALKEEPVKAFFPPSPLGRMLMKEIHLYYNNFLLGKYSCKLLGLRNTVFGKIAYLNILKNKRQEKKIGLPGYRDRMIRKGSEEQDKVKQIYLKYNHG
ncbi:DUF2236 domain-containing protein [Sphingobacterium spiritivorum]|nr:oxygenase MpaB family protein [Sphingobacterium spiritivorum]QQT26276.1 DUF2236 domain-containing protein [Sphingobacterium spiritivorum]